ncbi:MAG: hypothetical protein Q8K60_05190 [Parachlamydiaceae bacterium]|nr:hypothetical protein [Parachlamydiaceae bacterium]
MSNFKIKDNQLNQYNDFNHIKDDKKIKNTILKFLTFNIREIYWNYKLKQSLIKNDKLGVLTALKNCTNDKLSLKTWTKLIADSQFLNNEAIKTYIQYSVSTNSSVVSQKKWIGYLFRDKGVSKTPTTQMNTVAKVVQLFETTNEEVYENRFPSELNRFSRLFVKHLANTHNKKFQPKDVKESNENLKNLFDRLDKEFISNHQHLVIDLIKNYPVSLPLLSKIESLSHGDDKLTDALELAKYKLLTEAKKVENISLFKAILEGSEFSGVSVNPLKLSPEELEKLMDTSNQEILTLILNQLDQVSEEKARVILNMILDNSQLSINDLTENDKFLLKTLLLKLPKDMRLFRNDQKLILWFLMNGIFTKPKSNIIISTNHEFNLILNRLNFDDFEIIFNKIALSSIAKIDSLDENLANLNQLASKLIEGSKTSDLLPAHKAAKHSSNKSLLNTIDNRFKKENRSPEIKLNIDDLFIATSSNRDIYSTVDDFYTLSTQSKEEKIKKTEHKLFY